MKNGGNEGEIVGNGSGANSSKLKLIWIIVFILFLILVFVVFYVFYVNDFGDVVGDKDVVGVVKGYSSEMEACLKMESFDLDCNLLFSSPGIYVECENLGELRDECFYELAINTDDIDLCYDIDDYETYVKCSNNVIYSAEA